MKVFKNDLLRIKYYDYLNEINPSDIIQMYRCDLDFAYKHSNENFNKILDIFHTIITYAHPNEFKYVSIDSRTHMLMKGMYPAIPGWHCDDFYRPDNEENRINETIQPDFVNLMKMAPSIHYMILIGDCSLTQFLDEEINLPLPFELPISNRTYYTIYDELINEKNPKIYKCQPSTLYRFGPLAFHRAMPATERGWRSFIRMTLSNHRIPKNEIRYQSNVYLEKGISW